MSNKVSYVVDAIEDHVSGMEVFTSQVFDGVQVEVTDLGYGLSLPSIFEVTDSGVEFFGVRDTVWEESDLSPDFVRLIRSMDDVSATEELWTFWSTEGVDYMTDITIPDSTFPLRSSSVSSSELRSLLSWVSDCIDRVERIEHKALDSLFGIFGL